MDDVIVVHSVRSHGVLRAPSQADAFEVSSKYARERSMDVSTMKPPTTPAQTEGEHTLSTDVDYGGVQQRSAAHAPVVEAALRSLRRLATNTLKIVWWGHNKAMGDITCTR